MAEFVMYHNPKCGTSRGVLEILQERGADVEVIEYLKAPLSREQLQRIAAGIDVSVADLVRDDNRFKELGLDKANYTDPASVVELLVGHPELMQRPIVTKGDRIVLARPKEKVEALL